MIAPAVPVLTLVVLTSLPLTAIAAAFASRWLPGRWRPLRLLWLFLVYLAVESATLIALFGLWVASGFGRRTRQERWQRAHYAVMRWYLALLMRTAERRFHLRFRLDAEEAGGLDARARGGSGSRETPPPGAAPVASPVAGSTEVPASPDDSSSTETSPQPSSGLAQEVASSRSWWGPPKDVTLPFIPPVGPDGPPPLIVLSRHAGPGDSFILVHGLLQLGYRPRIVLRGTLRWAPTIDVALHRVPSFFLERGARPGTGTKAIAALSSGLRSGDALVLFPEGRNFTPLRRHHSIARLEELGQHAEAEDARELRHVLTPRTGGALSALDAAPTADVLFVAHAGLEDLSGVVDLWRGLPMDAAIDIKVWRVPAREIPRAREAQAAWLHWWWRRIDAWLLDRHGEEAVPDLVVEAVAEEREELEDLEELEELDGHDGYSGRLVLDAEVGEARDHDIDAGRDGQTGR